ncbi:MAG: DUF5788 family protein [Methanosarcinaceae archaeon]|nr:DUF5788 family protein [Methanosarcinaceae archaeon]
MSGDEVITEPERSKLLANLHKHLVWCGEKIPEKIEINGEIIPLHEIIWDLVTKTHLSESDEKTIDEYIVLLSEKEQKCETTLKDSFLSPAEAKAIFNRTAGLLRAIMYLKELEHYPDRDDRPHEFHRMHLERKVEEAKQWAKFMNDNSV